MTILYILLALVVLLVLITVHEFGHYTAGKIFGFKINEFSIGFGPKLYQKVNKKTGEVFSIRWFPLGGYCAFEGEDEDNPSKDAFNNKPCWRRLIVLVSGVLFNFIFGVLTAAIFLMVNGYGLPYINEFTPDSKNSTLFQKGDIVTKVNGKSVEAYRSMSDMLKKVKAGETVTITVLRDVDGEQQEIVLDGIQKYKTEQAYFYVSKTYDIENKVYDANGIVWSVDDFKAEVAKIQPNKIDGTNNYDKFSHNGMFFKKNPDGTLTPYTDDEIIDLAGISLVKEGDTSLGILYFNSQAHYNFFESILKAVPFCFYICGLILSTLGGLFTGATKVSDLGGTITAVSQIADYSKMGINTFLSLLPLLSMNLALFNILPIPALDGARCVFVLIEWIFRKPVPRKIENIIHTVGLFVLLGLVVFLDVYHFFIL